MKICPELNHFLKRLATKDKKHLEDSTIKMNLKQETKLAQNLSEKLKNFEDNNNSITKLENRRPLPVYQRTWLVTSDAKVKHEVDEGPLIVQSNQQDADEGPLVVQGNKDQGHENGGAMGDNTSVTSGESDVSQQYESRDRVNSFPKIDPSSIPKVLRRNSSFHDCSLEKGERRVLVIYTGGTIGMVRSTRGGLAPLANNLEKTVKRFPHLHDEHYALLRFGDDDEPGHRPLVLPEMNDEKFRVVYTIYEYDPLLDSTNMTMDDWIHVARDIKENYQQFDGFVVLHGTDTMAYTASALSFMLEHLGKSVVITGSQIPLFESRSDGRDNFLGALILAGSYVIPEVTVYFGHKLFRGNRITKVSCDSLSGFDSPNFGPLATMGISIRVDYNSIFRPKDISALQIHTSLNRNVGLLRIFPSITLEAVRVFLQLPTMGVVLQTYGSGNFPTNRKDLLEEIEKAAHAGILIINCTQCGHGSVAAIYETGQIYGVIPGFDMTPEAALTKLSYVLGRSDWSLEEKREMLQTNLKGELTKCSSRRPYNPIQGGMDHILDPSEVLSIGQSSDLVHKVVRLIASTLGMSLPDEIEEIQRVLGGSLTCAFLAQVTDHNYSEKNLTAIFGESGSEISTCDYFGRTPLHLAVACGDDRVVEFLLKRGASVHIRDGRGFSPLRDAVESDRHDVIRILRRCGAHLTIEPKALAAELNLAACRGDVARLKSFLLAGASFNIEDPCGRSPLHVAVEANTKATIEWLLDNGASLDKQNLYGQTPLDIARLLRRDDLIQIFENFRSKTAISEITGTMTRL